MPFFMLYVATNLVSTCVFATLSDSLNLIRWHAFSLQDALQECALPHLSSTFFQTHCVITASLPSDGSMNSLPLSSQCIDLPYA